MKIYTRTGDAGQTGLIGGARVAKDSLRMAAIGDVDELNAALGLVQLGDSILTEEVLQIQCRLFDLGAELAGGANTIAVQDVEALEASIDRQTQSMPPLRAFILPGGCPAAGALHLARTVCRRAERSVLSAKNVQPVSLAYLNRLSDWLFVTARTANSLASVSDVEWHAKELR